MMRRLLDWWRNTRPRPIHYGPGIWLFDDVTAPSTVLPPSAAITLHNPVDGCLWETQHSTEPCKACGARLPRHQPGEVCTCVPGDLCPDDLADDDPI